MGHVLERQFADGRHHGQSRHPARDVCLGRSELSRLAVVAPDGEGLPGLTSLQSSLHNAEGEIPSLPRSWVSGNHLCRSNRKHSSWTFSRISSSSTFTHGL